MNNGIPRQVTRFAAYATGGATIVGVFFFGTLFVLNLLSPTERSFDVRSLPRQTGVLAANGTAKAIEGTNPAGFLSFGPYVNLEPGNYAAVVEVVCDSKTNYADLVSDVGKNIIGKQNFLCDSTKEQLRIPFQLKQKATGLEIRVFFGGKGTMELAKLKIEETR